jgi:serine/threonine protein kinase
LIIDGKNGRFVKTSDFCLVTIHEFDGQTHTKYKRTIRYAAPELMRSRSYYLKADIYSLGFILKELFNIDIKEYLKYIYTLSIQFRSFILNQSVRVLKLKKNIQIYLN